MRGLRAYQTESINSVARLFFDRKTPATRQLGVLPTGSGKTVVAAHLHRHPTFRDWLGQFPRHSRRILFVAHREEIIRQAKSTFERFNPRLRVDIEQATRHASGLADVVVASINTMAALGARRLERFAPNQFRIVVVDEAHHATASSYLTLLRHFNLLPSADQHGIIRGSAMRGNTLLLGLTATPNRTDHIGLKTVFECIAFEHRLPELIEVGFLCPVRGVQVKTTTDLRNVRLLGEDFDERMLAAAVDVEERNRVVVKGWLTNANARQRTLAFCANVQHASSLADCFRRHGVTAADISGRTDRTTRRQAIQNFERGAIRVLTNCNVFSEGFDVPSIDCVIMARPTTSHLLYAQMVGRGTRISPGKTDCLLIDFVDVTDHCRLVTSADLGASGQPPNGQVSARQVKGVPESISAPTGVAAVGTLDRLPIRSQFVDLLRGDYLEERLAPTDYRWLFDAENTVFHLRYTVPTADDVALCIIKRESAWTVLRLRRSRDHAPDSIGHFATLIEAQRKAEELVKSEADEARSYIFANASWRWTKPSALQRDMLWRTLGVTLTDDECLHLTKGDVSDLIEALHWKRRMREVGGIVERMRPGISPMPAEISWTISKADREWRCEIVHTSMGFDARIVCDRLPLVRKSFPPGPKAKRWAAKQEQVWTNRLFRRPRKRSGPHRPAVIS